MARLGLSAFFIVLLAWPAWAGIDEGIKAFWQGDFEEAALEFRPLAEQGDARAQAWLGLTELQFYYDRKESALDGAEKLSSALKWLHSAVKQGEPWAELVLGTLYLEGGAIEKDVEKGLMLVTRAANRGDVRAQTELATMYEAGRLISQSDTEALKWWIAAAEQGSHVARHSVAVYYYQGKGVPKDYVKAYMWAKLGADQGYGLARGLQDKLRDLMTHRQIEEAELLVRECEKKHYKGCGL